MNKKRICKWCKKEIKIILNNSHRYHKNCFKEHRKEYASKHEEKESRKKWTKEYSKRPEVKKRRLEYERKDSTKKTRIKYREKDYVKKKREEKMREIRKKPENKIKYKARKKAIREIKIPKGKLCEVCNKNKATQRHHEDYSKPLEIKFLCGRCHYDEHRKDKRK